MSDNLIYEDAVSHHISEEGTWAESVPLESYSLQLQSQNSVAPLFRRPGGSLQSRSQPVFYGLPMTGILNTNSTEMSHYIPEQDCHQVPVTVLGDWEIPVMRQALLRQKPLQPIAAAVYHNICYFIACIVLHHARKSWFPAICEPYVSYITYILLLLFSSYIVLSIFELVKYTDQCLDLPLSDKQRQLLGLDPITHFDMVDQSIAKDPPIVCDFGALFKDMNLEKPQPTVVRPSLEPAVKSAAIQTMPIMIKPVLQKDRDLFYRHFSLNFTVPANMTND